MFKVILDTDPGVDDAMAIAYALCHPDIELLALTTVFGNVGVDLSTRNAQFVLDSFGAERVAVARGAAVPLQQKPLPPADFVHGADGLGNCYPAQVPEYASGKRHATLDQRDAADYIIEQARAQPGEITLIAVGPLTNIAVALSREPLLPSLIRELIIMGGTVEEPGNVSPVAEANFLNDPHAADAVFAADWPATAVGLDVTHRILIGDSHLAELRNKGGMTGDFIWRVSRFYVDFYTHKGAAQDGQEPSCAMHDAAAIAYLLMPEAFTVVRGAARVVDEGVAVGQLAIDRKGYQYSLEHWRNRPTSSGATMAVQADSVRRAFLDTIIQHHIA